MERIQNFISINVRDISSKVRTYPLNEIHLPSFLLGCFVVISFSLIGPLMKVFVGGILLTTITLLKYMVIIGGIVACIFVLTSKNTESNAEPKANKKYREDQPPMRSPRKREYLHNPMRIVEVKDNDGLVKDDFETIKYYDIPITKSQHNKYPVSSAYDKFINRAVHKNEDI